MIREMLNSVVRKYCVANKVDFQQTWRKLYKRFLRVFHVNLKVRARNRNMSKIAYAEKAGFITALFGLALIMFAGF